MTKSLVLLFALIFALFFNTAAKAQHCLYDFWGLIGIVPFSSDTSQVIEGLQITLVDSLGNPINKVQKIYLKGRTQNEVKETALMFWRNPGPNDDTNHLSDDIKTRHFYFTKNHYILVLPEGYVKKRVTNRKKVAVMTTQPMYVKIEDKDRNKNSGHFKSTVVKIPPEVYFPLCGVSVKRKSKVNYQPFFVKMQTYQANDYAPLDSVPSLVYTAPYDSVSTTIDSIKTTDGRLSTLQRTADYFKNINGKMTVVRRQVCTDKCFNCERTDCVIYLLKDGELKFHEFLQGAE